MLTFLVATSQPGILTRSFTDNDDTMEATDRSATFNDLTEFVMNAVAKYNIMEEEMRHSK